MENSKNRIKLVLALILIVLILSGIVIYFFNLQGQLKQSADKISALNTQITSLNAQITADKKAADTTSAQIQALQKEKDAMNAQFASQNAAIDPRLEPSLIDVIKRHADAWATGNRSEFISTLVPGTTDDYTLSSFDNVDRSKQIVTITEMTTSYDPFDERSQSDGFWLNVMGLDKNGELHNLGPMGATGVKKINGNWYVFGYD